MNKQVSESVTQRAEPSRELNASSSQVTAVKAVVQFRKGELGSMVG